MFNRFDPCCFSDPEDSRFQADFPGLDIRLTNLAIHGYSANDLLDELLKHD
jgi:hypothetical protein